MGSACSTDGGGANAIVTQTRGVVELRNRGLAHVPKAVWQDTTIRELWLNQNALTTLPKNIGNLTDLRGLYLLNNKLSSLPAQLGKLQSLTKLYLSYNELSSLPSEIGTLVALEELLVGDNKLQSLPASIGNLQHLKELDLGSNHIEVVPAQLNGLTNLVKLDLDRNRISQMPSNLRGLKSLETLSVRNSVLSTIPNEIGHLVALVELDMSKNLITNLPNAMKSLVNLRSLTLTGNQLSTLPPVIGDLRSLEVLWLNNNQITELPPQIGKLTNLQKLYLYNNALTSLPDEVGDLASLRALQLQFNELATLPAALGRLEHLEELNLRSNALISLPSQIGQLESLAELDVRLNKLTDLPVDLCEVLSLTRLMVTGNPLVKPPKDVVDLGITAILQYFRQSKYGDSNGTGKHIQVPSLPAELGQPPIHLGIQTLHRNDKVPLDQGKLRLWLGTDRLLSRMSTGSASPDDAESLAEMQEVYLRGALIPDYDDHGIQSGNYNHSWVQPHMCVPERLRNYRWRAVTVDFSEENFRADIVVDKLHIDAPKMYQPPLEIGQSKTYWLSSQGVNEIAFASTKGFSQVLFWMKLRLVPPDPLSTRTGVFTTQEGDWSLHLSMSGENDYRLVHPSAPSYRRYILCAGYRIDFLSFEPGQDTEWIPTGRGILKTKGGMIPNIHVALSLTRLDPEGGGPSMRRMSQQRFT